MDFAKKKGEVRGQEHNGETKQPLTRNARRQSSDSNYSAVVRVVHA